MKHILHVVVPTLGLCIFGAVVAKGQIEGTTKSKVKGIAKSKLEGIDSNGESSLNQKIISIVSRPEIADYNWDSKKDTDWYPDAYNSIKVGNEKFTHSQGIFRAEAASIVIWDKIPLNIGLYTSQSTLRVLAPDVRLLSQSEAVNKATGFAGKVFPAFFEAENLPQPRVDGPYKLGEFDVTWQRYDGEGLPTDKVRVFLRSIDGKVLAFSSTRFVGEFPHKVTPAQAKQTALKSVKGSPMWINVEVSRWNPTGANGRYIYEIQLKGVNKFSFKKGESTALVDTMTGKMMNSLSWEYTEPPSDLKSSLEDSLPIWTKHGLIFSSKRLLFGMPKWVSSPPQIFIRDSQGQISSVTSDLEGGKFSSVSAAPYGDWIVFNWHGWGYGLDLKQGNYRILSNPQRRLSTLAVQPDGKWSIGSGGSMTSRDIDLMPDMLERKPALALRGRLLLPKGDEHTPIFSADGKWLYFLRSQEGSNPFSSLLRIPASLAQTKERLLIKDDQKQTLIEKLPFSIERLSISPDGKNLVAQVPLDYARQATGDKQPVKMLKIPARIVVVDVTSKQMRELKLPPFKDTQVGATIQDINDAWAGPGNDEVTFSGKTIDANKQERRRIYSCRFDGSDFKALTPAENKPVPAYKFPEGNKTAYELAKEMALGEIQWEDAHRDR